MNTNLRRLLQACSLMTLNVAPLIADAQTPAAAAGPPAMSAPAATSAPPAPAQLTNEDASYVIGINFGQSLHQFGITNELSTDTIVRGLRDGIGGKKLEPADQRNLQSFIRTVMDAVTQRNVKAGKDFLDKNGHEKGVTTTASGLQYKILSAGDKKAASPGPADQVTVHYRGTLLDGTEFDSTASRGQPQTFQANGVIKGWQEALLMMKPGAKWKLWIPSDLAYGDKPRPGIPGGSLLNFDVDLVSVAKAPAATPPAVPTPLPSAPTSK